jgi:hypothetical protein
MTKAKTPTNQVKIPRRVWVSPEPIRALITEIQRRR